MSLHVLYPAKQTNMEEEEEEEEEEEKGVY